MISRFSGEVWFWRGPSPFHFVTVNDVESLKIKAIAPAVTYGWGMIPCEVAIGTTEYETALWPKGDAYILPVKSAVRKAEGIEIGDTIEVELRIG